MLAVVLLIVVPGACAGLLWWARCPGWRVVGGVAAGVILGPTILGRVLPQRHEAVFEGGAAEHATLLRDRVAAEAAGVDPRAVPDLTAGGAEAWRSARWSHQRPQRVMTGLLVAAMLAGAAVVRVRGAAHGHRVPAALSVGAWSAGLPGGLAFLALRFLWDTPAGVSALAAAAVAMGPWALSRVDIEAADDAELGGARLVESGGRVASAIAAAAAAVALVRAGLAAWCVPLAAVVAGWLIPGPPEHARVTRVLRGVLEILVVPAVAAAAAVRVDFVGHFEFWPVLVFMLLSGDGRWLGALCGALLPGGRTGTRTMRLVLGSMAAGPTQLALAAIAAASWSVPPPVTVALVLGAVLIEVTTPARRGMAERLK